MNNIIHFAWALDLEVKFFSADTSSYFENKKIYLPVMAESFFDKQLSIRNFCTDMIREVAHELGHFLAAPKNRRYQRDYGIISNKSRTESQKFNFNLDEAKATVVENELLKVYSPGQSMLDSYHYISRYNKADKWFKLRHPQIVKFISDTCKMIKKEIKEVSGVEPYHRDEIPSFF